MASRAKVALVPRDLSRILIERFFLTLRAWGSAAELLRSLEAGNQRVTPWAKLAIELMDFPTRGGTFEIGLVTPRCLEIFRSASRAEIYQAAREKGLLLCDPLTGPQWHHAERGKNKPLAELVRIGMVPIVTDPNHNICAVFERRKEDGRPWVLDGYTGTEEIIFSDLSVWAFRLPD